MLQRPQEDLELVFNSDIELDDNIIPETPTKKLLLPNQHHQHHFLHAIQESIVEV